MESFTDPGGLLSANQVTSVMSGPPPGGVSISQRDPAPASPASPASIGRRRVGRRLGLAGSST
jgi:hypothetical protein